jgi:hypothetical protein
MNHFNLAYTSFFFFFFSLTSSHLFFVPKSCHFTTALVPTSTFLLLEGKSAWEWGWPFPFNRSVQSFNRAQHWAKPNCFGLGKKLLLWNGSIHTACWTELKIRALIFTVGWLVFNRQPTTDYIGTELYTDVYLKYRYMCCNDCKWLRLQKLIIVVHLRWVL